LKKILQANGKKWLKKLRISCTFKQEMIFYVGIGNYPIPST
jgi:hypothetical protein